jgi:hypothetical protein
VWEEMFFTMDRGESMKTLTLETAKKLKEAGFPQESYFVWQYKYDSWDGGTEDIKLTNTRAEDESYQQNDSRVSYLKYFAAPTAEEVLEQLPEYYALHRQQNFFRCFGGENIHHEDGENGAEAAAKMWLYLKEHELLPERTTE